MQRWSKYAVIIKKWTCRIFRGGRIYASDWFIFTQANHSTIIQVCCSLLPNRPPSSFLHLLLLHAHYGTLPFVAVTSFPCSPHNSLLTLHGASSACAPTAPRFSAPRPVILSFPRVFPQQSSLLHHHYEQHFAPPPPPPSAPACPQTLERGSVVGAEKQILGIAPRKFLENIWRGK